MITKSQNYNHDMFKIIYQPYSKKYIYFKPYWHFIFWRRTCALEEKVYRLTLPIALLYIVAMKKIAIICLTATIENPNPQNDQIPNKIVAVGKI